MRRRGAADRSRSIRRNAAPRRAAQEAGPLRASADRGDELFILTNADGAEDFKIVTRRWRRPAASTGAT